jgi:hypothetical protein
MDAFKDFAIMTIADPVQVRRLAGNRNETIVKPATIEVAITASDAFVKAYTQNYNWLPTDPDYPAIKEASEYLASHNIRSAFPDEEDEAEEQKDWAIEMLDAINERLRGALAGGQVNIKTRAYRTNPANPNALYRRPNSVARTAEGVEPLRFVD